MTIVSSGAISINSLVGEYGGSAPHSMNEYYRGGSLVPNHSNTTNIPTSGTIQLDDFYGTSATSPSDNQFTITCGSYAVPGGKFGDTQNGYNSNAGSITDATFTNPAGTTTFTVFNMFHTVTTLSTSAEFAIIGNYNTQTLASAIGYSHTVTFSIGSTAITTDPAQASGVYNSVNNATFWQALGAPGTMPTSGSATFTIS